METTNEILDSTSHDCPLVTQAYSAAVAKGPHVPSSPTALGKGWVKPGAEHRGCRSRSAASLPVALRRGPADLRPAVVKHSFQGLPRLSPFLHF